MLSFCICLTLLVSLLPPLLSGGAVRREIPTTCMVALVTVVGKGIGIKKGVVENKIVDFDTVAMGPMLPWALRQIRENLRVMLDHAGGDDVANCLDTGLLDTKVEELRALAEEALRAQQEAR